MKIYVHKVRMNPIDGWGNSTGIRIEVLGRYSTKEKAVEVKIKRDQYPDALSYDIGKSWIEEEEVE